MLKFVLLVNKQGQTRLSQYFEYLPVEERVTTEADIVRKCLARNEDSVMYGPTSVYIERLLELLYPLCVCVCVRIVLVYGVQKLQSGLPSIRFPLLHSGRGQHRGIIIQK